MTGWPRIRPRTLAILLVGTVSVLGGWIGWFSPVRDWPAATGWDRIPVGERPAASPLWEAAAGDPPPVVWWLGHSGFLIEWHGRRIVLDPNTSAWCTVSRRVLEPAAGLAGPIDAVLLSHAHYDHLDLPSLRSLPGLGAVVVPAGSEGYVSDLVEDRLEIVPLPDGGRWRLGELEIVAVPAAHNGNRFHPLASRQPASGYVIRSPLSAVYFAGDTGWGDHFAAIRDRFHPRAAILPIGAYLPRLPMKYYHLNPEEAVAAARILGVEVVVPCHFGTFTLSLDRPSWALPRFARAARAAGVRWLMPRLERAETRRGSGA